MIPRRPKERLPKEPVGFKWAGMLALMLVSLFIAGAGEAAGNHLVAALGFAGLVACIWWIYG